MRWLMALSLLVPTFADARQDGKPGEKLSVSFESSVELETVVRDGKGETTRRLDLNRREKFAQVRVDDKTFKVECLSSSLQKSGSDTPLEEKATPLAGKAYFSTKTEQGWVVKDADGGAPPTEGLNLGAWNDVTILLPPAGAEPKAGEKWVVEGKDLLGVIVHSATREGAGKIECVCEAVEGGKATVLFSGQITGKGKDEGQTSLTLTVKTGRLTYDLGKKKPASVMLSGGFESLTDMVDIVRKPGTGANLGNEEERRKIGEIAVKSLKFEAMITFE
jgi:hypothetical protein